MDTLAAQAAEADRVARDITPAELAAGFNHLARLRHGGEPDYEQRGLGTAYLLYYAAKRAAVVAAALDGQTEFPPHCHVLDIGSGTDAVSLALSAMFPTVRFTIDAVEPSQEMAAAGQALTDLLPFPVTHYQGWMVDALSGAVLTGKQYDLVIMSAVLPYGWQIGDNVQKVLVGDQIERRMVEGGLLLVLEPRAKRKELAILSTVLARTHVQAQTTTLEPPQGDVALPRMTRLLRNWLGTLSIRRSLEPDGESLLLNVSKTGLHILVADIALVGRRLTGHKMSILEHAAAHPTPTYTRAPRTRPNRPRVTTTIPRRTWLISAALTAAAIALAATATIATL